MSSRDRYRTKRRSGVSLPIFGTVVVAAGVILTLNTLDVLRWTVWLDMWRLWPLVLVLLGVKVIFHRFHPALMLAIVAASVGASVGFAFAVSEGGLFGADFTEFEFAVQRGGNESLSLDIDFGAGTLNIGALAQSDTRLVHVTFNDDDADVERSTRMSGDTRQVSLKVDSGGIPFIGRSGSKREWTVLIHPLAQTTLSIDGGAGEFELDLRDTRVTSFDADIGAAELDIELPAGAGQIEGTIAAGAADITVVVPQGVAARIDNDSGVSSVNIDSDRFPKREDVHESDGYEVAENRVNLRIRAGASRISVK